MDHPFHGNPTGPDEVFVGASFVPRPWERPPYKPKWWLHILLFVLTLASTTLIGGLFWSDLPAEMADLPLAALLLDHRLLLGGLAFSVPLLTILFAHEMGHYIACRRHGLAVTPPYFIPFPVPLFGIGTLGAVIRIKEPIHNRRQLLDVGAWGPLAGFLAALPLLAVGILLSTPVAGPPTGAYLEFGEPLVYRVLESLLRPESGETVLMLHPTGVAAWFGLLVTLLNLLPFAQLDGGHVLYALFGRSQHRLAWPLLALFAALGLRWPGWWLWVVIALVMGLRHPPTWDDRRGLGSKRILVGWTALVVFALCFMIEPIRVVL